MRHEQPSLEEYIREVAVRYGSQPHFVRKWAEQLIDKSTSRDMTEAVEGVASLLELNEPEHEPMFSQPDNRPFGASLEQR